MQVENVDFPSAIFLVFSLFSLILQEFQALSLLIFLPAQ